ncbi:bifunctional hydroxymethylpyrimidine kinase/phosphomethylpyrimidine kinase [Psychroflexus montanilacus]|uniref:bifunctional hydroxymethylpyrimidine kinase/phosphomethylpyrimidine kinase n=1 Tax=Psychroflexus montanilacus TaxID=2873598 RepID=UPI001CCB9E44|nr:bifunctional hydroxymethylpyrimidine kinase/phosphomethylpyrimidine kinase [Psychroflexus montanilacus]MBZ9651904.1 bifunctional hydroxymethylpyrimidine kinase/phosphomethylpyrimidine kinase [Psychroflexus montanilacus]
MKTYPKLLIIAGSDSGGGAGIQADIKSAGACGTYSTTVITALTAQNTLGVSAIEGVSPQMISAQLKAVLEDIGTDAVKIGMLHSKEVIEVIAKHLKYYQPKSVVLDPVMVATSGDRLLKEEAMQALMETMIPLAEVITPNVPEMQLLLGENIENTTEFSEYAKALAEKFQVSVLLKAGHLEGEHSTDILFNIKSKQLTKLSSPRIDTKNTHGTGCSLSSALGSYLAQGFSLEEAAQKAKAFIHQAIKAGSTYRLGGGSGPIHHFYNDK